MLGNRRRYGICAGFSILLAVFTAARGAESVSEQTSSQLIQLFQKAQDVKKASSDLEKEWEGKKKEYRGKFAAQLVEIDRTIGDLERELDQGDPKVRNELNEQLGDLRRTKDLIKQVFHEITAATAINWGNIPGRIKNRIEDIKD